MRTVSRNRRFALGILFVASLAITQYVPLYSSIYFVVDPSLQHEEIRILFPYHRYADADLFRSDYITQYLESINNNHLFKLMNLAWASAFGDLAPFHRYVVPLLSWLILLAGVFVAGNGMGGLPVAWGALAMALSQTNIFYQVLSSTPHAFAFPLLVWILAAMQRGQYWALMLLIILSAFLYPPCAVIGGLSFAWLLIPTREERQALPPGAWGWGRRLLALVFTGAIALGISAISLDRQNAFGEVVEPGTQAQIYPEAGSKGRHFIGTQKPIVYTMSSFAKQFHISVGRDGVAKGLFLLYILICLAFLVAKRDSRSMRPLWAFCGGSLIAGLLGVLLVPALAYRFLYYPLHTLFLFAVPLIIVWGVQRYSSATGPLRRHLLLSTAVAVSLLSTTMDRAYPGSRGALVVRLSPEQQAVLAFIASTPKDTVVAGWPTGLIESVPYFAWRPAFLLNKTHYPTHTLYLEEMRRRMYATIDAYYGADVRPTIRLREQWGVDLLIVSKAHLGEGLAKAHYFEPFDSRLKEMARADPERVPYLLEPDPGAVVFRAGDLVVVDLRRL